MTLSLGLLYVYNISLKSGWSVTKIELKMQWRRGHPAHTTEEWIGSACGQPRSKLMSVLSNTGHSLPATANTGADPNIGQGRHSDRQLDFLALFSLKATKFYMICLSHYLIMGHAFLPR
jgi:hypothetical protein